MFGPYDTMERVAGGLENPPQDLENQPIVMHEESSSITKALRDFLKKDGISINVSLEFTSNEAVKRSVENSTGVALISQRAVTKETERKELVAIPLSDPTISRKFYLIYHKEKYLSQVLEKFLTMTRK